MSRFSGRQGKGAMARHRAAARAAAEERQAAFRLEVGRVAREQNVDEPVARSVAAASGRVLRAFHGPRRATAPVTTVARLTDGDELL